MSVSISRDQYFHEIELSTVTKEALKWTYTAHTVAFLEQIDSLCRSPHLKTLKLLRDEYGYFALYCVFSKRDQK